MGEIITPVTGVVRTGGSTSGRLTVILHSAVSPLETDVTVITASPLVRGTTVYSLFNATTFGSLFDHVSVLSSASSGKTTAERRIDSSGEVKEYSVMLSITFITGLPVCCSSGSLHEAKNAVIKTARTREIIILTYFLCMLFSVLPFYGL